MASQLRRAAVTIVVAVTVVLSGCATSAEAHRIPTPLETVEGVPQDWDGPSVILAMERPAIGRVGSSRLGLATVGASSCPLTVTHSVDPAAAEVDLYLSRPAGSDPCSADLAVSTIVFDSPLGASALDVRVHMPDGTSFSAQLPEAG